MYREAVMSAPDFQDFILSGRKNERVLYWVGELARDAQWGFETDKVTARLVQNLAWVAYQHGQVELFQKRGLDGKMQYFALHR